MIIPLDPLEKIGIFLVSVVLFAYGVQTQAIIGFESRFYVFALEMWQNGPSWFPTTYGRAYPDYPATFTFLIYCCAVLLGEMNKLAAVIPSAIAAAMTMVWTYQIGALQNKRWGWCALCFLLLTIPFLKSARSISLDMMLTCIVTGCFYIAYSAEVLDDRVRTKWIYYLLLLGFALRGPIGLIMPTGVVCLYYLQGAVFRRLFFVGVSALLLLLISLLLLAVIADAMGGKDFLNLTLHSQVLGRIVDSHVPFYFYLTQGLQAYALTAVFAVLTILGVIYYEECLSVHTPALKLLLKLVGWTFIIVIGMSVPGDKKMRYILPIAPALALLAAYIFVAPRVERYFLFFRWLSVRFFLLFPGLLFAGLFFLTHHSAVFDIKQTIDYPFITKMFLVMLAINVALWVSLKQKTHLQEIGVLLIATLSFLLMQWMVIEPIQQALDHTRDFVQRVETARRLQQAALVFYQAPPDGWPIKYLANRDSVDQPLFVTRETGITAYPYGTVFITSETHFRLLSQMLLLHVIATGQVGRVPVVAFMPITRLSLQSFRNHL